MGLGLHFVSGVLAEHMMRRSGQSREWMDTRGLPANKRACVRACLHRQPTDSERKGNILGCTEADGIHYFFSSSLFLNLHPFCSSLLVFSLCLFNPLSLCHCLFLSLSLCYLICRSISLASVSDLWSSAQTDDTHRCDTSTRISLEKCNTLVYCLCLLKVCHKVVCCFRC